MDQANIYNLAHYAAIVPDGAVVTQESSVLNVLPINVIGMALGLHVRCGIEDALKQDRSGKMSLVEQTGRLVRIAGELGCPDRDRRSRRAEICKIGVFTTPWKRRCRRMAFAPNRNGGKLRLPAKLTEAPEGRITHRTRRRQTFEPPFCQTTPCIGHAGYRAHFAAFAQPGMHGRAAHHPGGGLPGRVPALT